ncbi:MAG: RNA polymerase subunit sigma-70, partial [Parasporobacterium sp.]|nr:RNA polymerase subunit sigma-70 [Parasporobacterium sp.]
MDETVRLEDDAIIGLYFGRDENAIRETDKAYGRELLLLSRRILSNREDAEENCSDTYLSA